MTNRLHGRVTRLYFTPLIRSLQQVAGLNLLLTFLDSFRYPLAGEFTMVRDLAGSTRYARRLGLEVGVLSEIYRNCALRRICQADIADAYEHKHRDCPRIMPNRACRKCAWISPSPCSEISLAGWCCRRACSKTFTRHVSSVGPGSHHAIPK